MISTELWATKAFQCHNRYECGKLLETQNAYNVKNYTWMCDKCESEWVLRWEAHLMPLIPYSICWCICISTVANDDGHQICFYFASKSSTRRKRKFDNKEEREHHKKK